MEYNILLDVMIQDRTPVLCVSYIGVDLTWFYTRRLITLSCTFQVNTF